MRWAVLANNIAISIEWNSFARQRFIEYARQHMLGLTVILGATATGLLWMSLVAPALARLFRVPLAFGIWRIDRRNQHLTHSISTLFDQPFLQPMRLLLLPLRRERYGCSRVDGDRILPGYLHPRQSEIVGGTPSILVLDRSRIQKLLPD